MGLSQKFFQRLAEHHQVLKEHHRAEGHAAIESEHAAMQKFAIKCAAEAAAAEKAATSDDLGKRGDELQPIPGISLVAPDAASANIRAVLRHGQREIQMSAAVESALEKILGIDESSMHSEETTLKH